MSSLPQNFNCSELTVHPKGWKYCKASALAHKGYIQYHFYDSALKKRKFVILKGMNSFRTLDERREATKQLIENELHLLMEKGYNPITGKFAPFKDNYIEATTPFVEALRKAFDLMKLE